MKNKYFQFTRSENEAEIRIYGDIVDDTIWGGVSALSFAEEMDALGEVEKIKVYINSYGGSVSQGNAIYNMLKSHPAKVTTICDGFACSIASIIFLAGDFRIMNPGSILMIHEPWSRVTGNADELAKEIEVLKKLTDQSVEIYARVTGLSQETIRQMLKEETWLLPQEAVELGFATTMNEGVNFSISASVKESLIKMIKEARAKEETMQEPMESRSIEETITEIVSEPKMETEPMEAIKIEMEMEEKPGMKLNENKNNFEMEELEMSLNRDNEIMVSRGQRQLTNAEEKFYNRFAEACKSRNPQQAFIELENEEETAMPETILEDVFKDMVENHPLLARVNAVYAGYSTKWILNAHEKQSAAWGAVDAEITKEITSAFRMIDIKQHKLSAFAQIPMGLLELGKHFLDAYIRKALADSIASALEEAIINGDGKDCPVGLMRNLTGAVDGVHQAKTEKAITEFSPKQVNEVVAEIAKTQSGHARNVDRVQLIVNNKDYLTKVLPAIQTLNNEGRYVAELPFPTEIIVCNAVPDGKAVMCKLDEYFLGVANGKDGQIEFSDDYKFLEDQRTFKVKVYATGMPMDDNMAQVLDISGLTEKAIKVKNVE